MTPLVPTKSVYYRVRSETPTGRFKRAANFVYLNYACWNGLYRVNSSGRFNVPFGRPKTKNLADPENMKQCSRLLGQAGIDLRIGDFEAVVGTAESGDFVYFDPPYVTRHNRNGFRDYNESLFSWSDQERLAAVATRLAARRVYVLVSNARHPDIAELYPDFEPILIDRKSTLAADARSRGRVDEMLLVPTWMFPGGSNE